MRIELTRVMVEDQAAALDFYTEVLGFVKKKDFPLGEEARWLTVVSPEAPDGTELLLEPNSNPAGKTYQGALFEQGIPAASFAVDDIEGEHLRLTGKGVVFRTEPVDVGGAIIAVFEDTCGNLIQIYQEAQA